MTCFKESLLSRKKRNRHFNRQPPNPSLSRTDGQEKEQIKTDQTLVRLQDLNHDLYTAQEVRSLLRISESTLRRMIRDGRLPGHVKIGGRHRFKAALIRRYMSHGEYGFHD